MTSKLLRYLLRGLLLIGPISITFYIIYLVLDFFDGLITEHIPGIAFPGLGLLIIIPSLIILGWLGGTILAQPFSSSFKRIIKKAPIVELLYNSIKDVLNALVGQQKKFSQPVLVKLNEQNELYRLGYITQSDLSSLGISVSLVAVYLPHSYNFSGNLFLVPARNIKEVDYNSGDFMKFVVSGGVTNI